MTYPTANIVNTVGTGGTSTRPFIEIFLPRDPGSNDLNGNGGPYQIQQRWWNTATDNEWVLVGYLCSNGAVTANWKPISSNSTIDSFIPNSGTSPVVPDANAQITLQGTGSITTVGGTNSLTPQLTGLTNHNVLVGAGTATITKVSPSTSGFVLTSNGVSADPSFQATTTTGAWTPGITFGGGSTGITYSNQIGEYMRIGNVVYISCVVTLSNKGSSTGVAVITGLPLASGGNSSMIAIPYVSALTFTANYTNAHCLPSGTTLQLQQFGSLAGGASSAITTLADTNFLNNSNFQFTGFYFLS